MARMHRFLAAPVTVLLLLGSLSPGWGATLELAFPFSPHAVLQREAALPVWGTGTAGRTVRVTLAGVAAEAVCDEQGAWRVDLPGLPAGGPHVLEVQSGEERTSVPDVLLGDVWLCSGQSNMVWPLKKCDTWEQDRGTTPPADLRLLDLNPGRAAAAQPVSRLAATWSLASPRILGDFSAVAYYTGLELRRRRGVPVGLISASWGGTGIESWISPEALASSPASAGLAEAWARHLADFPSEERRYREDLLVAWQRQATAARARGAPIPRKPAAPRGPGNPELVPGSLFNGMIHPLVPYALAGVVWYQGEENATTLARAEAYRMLLPVLAADWRYRFGRQFGFHVVQLPRFGHDAPGTDAAATAPWAMLRESQAVAVHRIPYATLTPTIDLGDPDAIHPRHKKTLALRVARTIHEAGNGSEATCGGPECLRIEVHEAMVTVIFRTRDPLRVPQEPVRGFQLAGADGRFQPCLAQVQADRVLLSDPGIPDPIQVRYAWGSSPDATLTDTTGRPAAPFRWPGP